MFSAVKLALLVGLAAAIPTTGVFVSWVAAIALSVVPLGLLVFRRLVPRHIKATEERETAHAQGGRTLPRRRLHRLALLARRGLSRPGDRRLAGQFLRQRVLLHHHDYLGGTTNLLAINMRASLTVEGSHDPARLAANTRAAIKRMALIMLPVCGLLFVGAPFILHVFGDGYAHAATPLLRWFAVGALLRVVMETYFAVLRAQSRTSGLAYLQGLLCVLVLGLTVILLPRMGLTGAGVAEISSLAAIVSIAAPKLFKIVRTAPPTELPAGAAPDGDLADLGARDVAAATPREAKRGPAWALHRHPRPRRARRLRPPGAPPGRPPGRHPTHGHTQGTPGPPPDLGAQAATSRSGSAGGGTGTGLGGFPGPGGGPGSRRSLRDGRFAPRPDRGAGGTSSGSAAGRDQPPPTRSRRTTQPHPHQPSATADPHPSKPGVLLGFLLISALLLLYWVPAPGLDDVSLDARLGGLGLISVLPLPTLIGAALLITVFASLLWMNREHRGLLLITLLATVISLHALPAVIETEPRFATAWQHLGFIDYIDRTGSAVPDLDARWSWPGFFAGPRSSPRPAVSATSPR